MTTTTQEPAKTRRDARAQKDPAPKPARPTSTVDAAMQNAGIPTGVYALPVTVYGFSLGGLSAGSPVGAMGFPPDAQVTSLEASQDVVATMDGRNNPSRPGWVTVHQDAPRLASEPSMPIMDPNTVHQADRNGVMAVNSPAIDWSGGIDIPPGGHVDVDDYYPVRK